MKKKVIGLALCAMLFALCVSAQAQQTGKVFRIGYLDASTASGSAVLLDTFRQEMSKLGWIEGRNLTIDHRFAEGKGPASVQELAAELVRLRVDLIVVTGRPPALAAKSATTTIPIVVASVSNPVELGLVASLARPGGNVTGFSNLATDLGTKRLEILKDVVPKLARVGILRTPGGSDLQLKELRPAAQALKLKLEEIDAKADPIGIESAFKTAKEKQVGAIMTISNPPISPKESGSSSLPAIYFQKEFVEAGGLMSYGADYVDLYRRAAVYVDKILKGAKPADLPVQQATKFEFVINLKAAKQIGLTIPPDVLARADRVIR